MGTGADERPLFQLPSNGWRPGDVAMMARISGPFHAGLVAGTPQAWLGEGWRATTWPEGFRVRLDPAELVDPEGRVVGRQGDLLAFAGGVASDGTVVVQSWPLRRP